MEEKLKKAIIIIAFILISFAVLLLILYINKYGLSSNKLIEIDRLEDEIDDMRSIMTEQHIERLENNECSPASSGVFINLVSNLERAGDHLSYIAHAIVE